jgi:hypothetical protein
LDGTGPQPEALWIARLTEAFQCLPSEAIREWRAAPVGYLEEVLEARAYEQAKAMTDAADSPEARKRLPKTELFQMVTEIEFDLVREAREKPNG